ncbi:extracellular solute-binding protein [Seohaeicola zhoushanensis]|uniref:ABC transporter substrate-binding protein n=1 Tax=Seohaeicola zhoushanensis TaxID=1569283 RepID=A0A8J3GUL8_9RHOB|nr:extracellular solute-binding protein [Seohaeicola zhoushanensis]GHF37133.1 ABC transporter substrate-binding protein [Seohaeicola zhoushanensis]
MTQTRSVAATRVAEPAQRLLASLLVLVTALGLAGMARGEETIIKSHGYSFYGDLTYPADFDHFAYVNPEAPKGGEISFAALGTFDSMNPYAVKGRAGRLATMMYESLLTESADTYDEGYGLLAESVEYDEGKNWVIFHMRPEAKFSDGTPVTAHDVKFSHELLLEQGLPSYRAGVSKRMKSVEVIDDHTIKFTFVEGISRRSLIDQVGGVPVWSKKWYEETGARLDESRLETSPGSGPYMIESVNVNRRIVYKRNPDYWGWKLPINKGRFNFDRIRVEYFGDDTVAFEAFKAGDYTFRVESDSKKWASNYNFPKITDGQVIRTELPDGTPPTATGIVFNLRRDVMKDKRLREAVALAYNFEWTNESLQYGLFKQRTSFSENTPIMATGAPEGAELDFLKSLGDLVPPEMLTEPARMPHTSSPERLSDRRNLRSAMKLLDEAGWPVGSDGKRRNAKGELLKLNFLFDKSNEGTLSGVMENFVANLEAMGITATLEKVDSAQYTLRERENDYDLIFDFYRPFLGTGTGLAQMYGTPADGGDSLFNPAGLASPLIDRIIDASLQATSVEEERATLMALDRALRHEFIMIPVWYKPNYWVAYYDQYEHPDPLPPFDLGYLDFWWFDQAKAEALRAAGALR